MRFLIDAQLPPGLLDKLSAAGHDATHVAQVLSPSATDVAVASEANRQRAILASKDEDFVDLSVRGILRSQFLWIRLGNMTTDRLWVRIEPRIPEVNAAFAAGEKIVELR